jgi:hypothetical protein
MLVRHAHFGEGFWTAVVRRAVHLAGVLIAPRALRLLTLLVKLAPPALGATNLVGMKKQILGNWKQDLGAGGRLDVSGCAIGMLFGPQSGAGRKCVRSWLLQSFAELSGRSVPPALTIATIGTTKTRQATRFTALRAGTRARRRIIRQHVVTAVSPIRSTIAGHVPIMAASPIGIEGLATCRL